MKAFYKLLIPAFILFAGCSASRFGQISSLSGSGSLVGIQVIQEAPIGIFTHSPETVYVAKLADPQDIYSGDMIRSGYVNGENAYLMNPEPGTYVVIGGSWEVRDVQTQSPIAFYLSIYDEQTVRASKFDITAGTFIFLGNLRIKDSITWIRSDDNASPYVTMLEKGRRHNIISGDAQYTGKTVEFDTGEKARASFIKKAKEDFRKTKWLSVLR